MKIAVQRAQAAAREGQGDLSGTIAPYDRALTIDASNIMSWCNRGHTLAALGLDG